LHQNARQYFKYFLEHKVEIYLSSIVVAEYSVKDDVFNLPLEFVKILPFDFFDGKVAGEFHSILISKRNQIADIERNVIKDDCKLIAQIYNRKIAAYISKDKSSFGSIFKPLQEAKNFQVELIDLEMPLNVYLGELF